MQLRTVPRGIPPVTPPIDARTIGVVDPFVTIQAVCAMLGLSQTPIYENSKLDPSFPKPERVTSRANRCLQSEVLAWRAALPDLQSRADAAKAIHAERTRRKASCASGADDDGAE